MPFDPVDPKQSFPDLEKGILQYWKEEDIFKRSIKSRSDAETFSFFDGPPFATGLPHYGHLLAGTIKDVIPRYQTMRGKKVERRFGWDCHGLPVENLVEKENNIKSKQEIEDKGTKWFNDLCRGSVQRYTEEWKKTVERTGRWVDMDWDYRTMDPEYMESIWWVFKQLYEKGLIYEGHKAMHICPRCVTPLSNFEVTLGYTERTDMSTIATFPLVEDPKTVILAWTTTTWSLPGDLWLGFGADIPYVKVKQEGDDHTYIVSEKLAPVVFKGREHEIVGSITAKELDGKKYIPLFDYCVDMVMPSTVNTKKPETFGEKCFHCIIHPEVAEEEGTGIVHFANANAEDGFKISKDLGVDLFHYFGVDGRFYPEIHDFAGLSIKASGDNYMETDKIIIEKLKESGRWFNSFHYTHSYPLCWRCDTPLLNYVGASWYVSVEKIKEEMIKNNKKTHWVPNHIRDGRFGKWLEGARDWAISRSRYWGTPLPIWRSGSGSEGKIEVIGSRDELMSKCPDRFTKITALRHAESEGNLIPIYQGELPGTDLTKKGRGQASETGKSLKKSQVSIIYASPLARTKQTAEIIAKKVGAKVVVDERLREVGFGEYEGKTVDFSDLTFVKERRAHKIEKDKPESIYHFDGMEPWDAVQGRIEDFFSEILSKHKGEHVVVVSHADPVVNMKHFFTGEDPVKLSHQPYPEKAHPYTFFFDHETGEQMDLHKETVDNIAWAGSRGEFKRIPDVLDCWFESGSMPYAQSHFPFENGDKEPKGFPADFIAEGLDQTRGWFYTLMVLSAALFKKPAFINCVVNGIVLAEDGKKMSKSLKNYPEPMIVVDKYGADAMRFALMASPAVRGENLRFSEDIVEETLRRVILPLWNTYSFFVLHANEANWRTEENHQSPIANHQRITNHQSTISNHPLDSWILAEVQDLVNRMTNELDKYDLSATCAELHETLDGLTNWYVRRSRRRFAGKEGQEQQQAALATLYDVLLTFCKLLAPFCPFITDAIYLNLIPEDHGSIHMTDWPESRKLTEDETALIEKTRLMRIVVSLGMKLRSEANVKVRQPLSKAEIVLPTTHYSLLTTHYKILAEELNVKEVNIIKDASHLADKIVEVDARKVGPRLGAKVQEVIRSAKEGKFEEGKNGTITVLGEKLSSEEARVTYCGKEGHEVACERGVIVSLETSITDDLKLEGLARDVVRSIQSLRKDAGLKVSDRITLEAGAGLDQIMDRYKKLIEDETNGEFSAPRNGVLHVSVTYENGVIKMGGIGET
jgi:isoleucyl-tRNA synthetase